MSRGRPAPSDRKIPVRAGWSQAWRDKVREERSLQLLSNDPHAPAEFRANGAAVNHDGFHAAFATEPGDAMFRPADERIRIW